MPSPDNTPEGGEPSAQERGHDRVPVDPDTGSLAVAPNGHRRANLRVDVLGAVAAAGALGTAARFELSRLWPTRAGQFPTTTFAVNLTGSFLLGFVLVLLIERLPPTRFARPFLAIGLIGAYTTFSTFAVEAVELVRDHEPAVALVYVASSVVGGLLAAWLGTGLARAMPHRHPAPPAPSMEERP